LYNDGFPLNNNSKGAIKINKQITVQDENGQEIGRTFSRRAKQLTMPADGYARAEWLDYEHTAIRLKPPYLKEDYNMEEKQQNNGYKTAPPEDGAQLLKLAKAKVRAKQSLKLHVILVSVIAFIGFMAIATEVADYEFGLFWSGCMFTGLIHLVLHIRRYRSKFKTAGRSYVDPVEAEYRKLKLMTSEQVAAELRSFAD